MALNLKDLMASGAFVQEPIVEREVTWINTNGKPITMTVWVRKASYHTITQTWKAAEGNQEHLAARLATMICDADGAPVFTTADVLGTADPDRGPICDMLFLMLISAVNEVNGLAPDEKKKSPQKTTGSN
jgi:hypothetical protein